MKLTATTSGKPLYEAVTEQDVFSDELFHMPEYQPEGDESFAFHCNLGSITVVDRMTGFGWRDVETGFRDLAGNFWLASGERDVRTSGCKTIGEAIAWVKKEANTCIPDLSTGETK